MVSNTSNHLIIFQKQLIENNKAESEKRMREMQANLEKLEAAHKTSVAQYTELEKQKLTLENDLKNKDNQNIELTKEQKSRSQEIQKLTQNIKSLNDQLSSKVVKRNLSNFIIFLLKYLKRTKINLTHHVLII